MEFSDSRLRNARATRSQYLRSLMVSGCAAAIGLIRGVGQMLKQARRKTFLDRIA